MINLTSQLRLVALTTLFAVSLPVFAVDYSYCPQTINCTIPDGSVFSGTCDAPAGWIAKPTSYQGTIPSEVTLSFYSAQSYPNYSPPGSYCDYFYQASPDDFAHNILIVVMASSKSFAPPPPAGYWQKDQDPVAGGEYYWCYSKFVGPISPPSSNQSQSCPFVVIGNSGKG
jgi:hypothetical protein